MVLASVLAHEQERLNRKLRLRMRSRIAAFATVMVLKLSTILASICLS